MNELSKSLDNVNDLIKGGKRAIIGEQRMFSGRMYVKTQDGWKFVGKGNGQKPKLTSRIIL